MGQQSIKTRIPMSIENVQMTTFLQQLYELSNGDFETEVSMYDIGSALGLEKNESGAIAEDLLVEGYAELKNLAGGISITSAGLQALNIKIPIAGADSGGVQLGNTVILDGQIIEVVVQLLVEIKSSISERNSTYANLEEVVIDIKTMEVQLLSPKPKTAVIREVLRSLSSSPALQDNGDITTKIRTMTGE